MFAAAAGIALAKRLNATLEFEHYRFRKSSRATLPYELGSFNLPGKLVLVADWRNKPEAAAYRWWKKVIVGSTDIPTVWRQLGHHFDPQFGRLTGSVYLKGYFQSWLYFDNAADEVRKAFDLRPLLSEGGRLRAQAAELAGKRAVAVHVRRGDYTLHTDQFALLQKDYYERAVRLITRAVERPIFYVVSDDLTAARAMFADQPGTTFAEGGGAFDDMHLISSCHHHIIANSTFSWWGAWLSPWADGVTIAPRTWFSRPMSLRTYMDDMFPAGWLLM